MVTLRPIDADNYEDCITLSVKAEQKRFIATNENGLAQSYVYRDIFHPYGVYAGEQMVGFVLLNHDSSDDFWIMRFMIDGRYQKNGYGGAAMELALDKFKNAGAKYARLCVEEENSEAQRFYEKHGFKRNGLFIGNEPIMEVYL